MTTKTKILLTAQDKTKAAFKSVEGSLKGMERTVAGAQKAFGLLLGAGAIGGLIKGIADASLAMDRFERAFKVATGSAAGASREMEFVIRTSQELGISIETSAGAFAKLSAAARGTVLQGQETRNIFTAISQASVVLGLTAEQTGGALTAIEQIISKGKVSAEELRGQLGERLPGAFQIAARSIGVTTSKLDEMLRKGEVLAEDLLPKFAEELKRVFAPEVEAAADSAQASFARFGNAMFLLKDSIGRSGVLDSLADLADGFSRIIAPTLEQEIQIIVGALEDVKNFNLDDEFGSVAEGLNKQLDALLLKQGKFLDPDIQLNEVGFLKAAQAILNTSSDLDAFFEKQDKDLEKLRKKFVKEFETAEDEVSRRLGEFDLVAAMFPEEDQERIRAAIKETLFDGLEEIEIKVSKRLPKNAKEGFDAMTEASKQASRNIQDAFVEFLFDPFDKGVKGMLKSFLDAIRRILANQAATQLFGFLNDFINPGGGSGKPAGGSSGSTPGSIPLPGFANGGDFTVGGKAGIDSNVVAFRATRGENVSIRKPGQSGGVTVVNNIQIDGLDEARTVQMVEVAAEEGSRRAVDTMIGLRSKGRF